LNREEGKATGETQTRIFALLVFFAVNFSVVDEFDTNKKAVREMDSPNG
jgi:hypothetical protein